MFQLIAVNTLRGCFNRHQHGSYHLIEEIIVLEQVIELACQQCGQSNSSWELDRV